MNRKILNLAIPNIISNLIIPMLGIVDLTMMGHLGNAVYIGAIALGGMILNFIYWGFNFLRMGTSGFTAQAYGEKNQKEIISIIAGGHGRNAEQHFDNHATVSDRETRFWVINGSEEVKYYAFRYFISGFGRLLLPFRCTLSQAGLSECKMPALP